MAPVAMAATRALLLLLLLLRGAGAEEGEGPCPELLYGIGLHGTGPICDRTRLRVGSSLTSSAI